VRGRDDAERSAIAPELPTLDEAGLPGYEMPPGTDCSWQVDAPRRDREAFERKRRRSSSSPT